MARSVADTIDRPVYARLPSAPCHRHVTGATSFFPLTRGIFSEEGPLFRAHRSWLVCSCLVLALSAAGCGDDDVPADTPTAPSNPTPPTTTPPVVTPPTPTTFTISGTVTRSEE